MVEFAESEKTWQTPTFLIPVLIGDIEPLEVEDGPDTRLHAIPGPPRPAASWVIETWRNAARRRTANEHFTAESLAE